MSYRKTTTNCIVAIIHLAIPKIKQEQCFALRQEAGRCWSDLISAHAKSRESSNWMSEGELKKQAANTYQLHSQSVQALVEKLIANVEMTRTKIQDGDKEVKYPHKPKQFQNVIWKQHGIRLIDGRLHLSNGRGREPLILKLPVRYREQNIKQVELGWDVNHYVLYLTIDTGVIDEPFLRQVKTAGVDLGEIHIAAVVTDDGKGLLISGRQLRSVKRLRNKRHAQINQKLSRTRDGSRKNNKLKKSKAKVSSKFTKQQRDILHKASRQVVNFCKDNQIANIVIGDVRDISDGVNLGRKTNQKISQWAHGQFVGYVSYKSRVYGIPCKQIPEDYSSRTCSKCGHRNSQSPRNRNYICEGCGEKIHRDFNGSSNICSRGRYGEYGKVQVIEQTYLQPIKIGSSSPSEPRQVADEMIPSGI